MSEQEAAHLVQTRSTKSIFSEACDNRSSLISYIYKHKHSYQCYSSKLKDKCDAMRRNWKWHRQKGWMQDITESLDSTQSEEAQPTCIRRAELGRGLQGKGLHSAMVPERQEHSNQARACTEQISTACLAPQHRFSVNEEHLSSSHRCLNWVMFVFSEHLGNPEEQAQMQIFVLLLLKTWWHKFC